RSLLRSAGWVADPRGVVADDQHDDVTRTLELRQPIENVREAEMDVGRRRVDAELHTQRTIELQLALELVLRQHVDRVAREVGGRHGAESKCVTLRGSRSRPRR